MSILRMTIEEEDNGWNDRTLVGAVESSLRNLDDEGCVREGKSLKVSSVL